MDNYNPFANQYTQVIRNYDGRGVSTLIILRDPTTMTEEAIAMTQEDVDRWEKISDKVPLEYDYDAWFRRNSMATAKDWLDQAEKIWGNEK